MQDYYSILGLDADASPESVKIAYRRLARQHHPDFRVSSSEAEKASIDAHMAHLNEAYAVLSNAKSRREYDDRVRLENELASSSGGRAGADTGGGVKTAVKVHQPRYRPRHEVDSAVVTQFSGHLRQVFMNNKRDFSWKQVPFEGFDWGLEALSWSAHYYVALRGFSTVDSANAKKFVNYAETVIERCKRHIRKRFFLFLLPYHQMIEWESVSHQLQPFVNGRSRTALPPAAVVLIDTHHSRILRMGPRFSDKRFDQLSQSIRTTS